MTDVSAASPPPATPAPPPGKKSLVRRMLRWVIELVIVLFLGALVLYLARNALIREGIVRQGAKATGQTTTLDATNLAVLAGNLDLDSLAIANLKDYKEPHILTMKKGQVIHVAPLSILGHTVKIESIKLTGVELTLEQHGTKNNLAELIDAIQTRTAAAGNTPGDTTGKELKIGLLELEGTRVHIRSDLVNLDLDLGPIRIPDPTNPDGRLPKIADLVGKILLHISQQLMDDPALPAQIRSNMKNVSAIVDNVRGKLDKEVGGLKNIQKELTTNPAGAIKDLQNLGKDAPKNLQDLLNGNKKEPGK